jgi:hypothetical protein
VSKHQHKQTSEMRKKKSELTFRDLGFGIPRLQKSKTSTHKQFHVGPTLRDFGVSGFQMPNNNTQQLPKCEKGERMWNQHFGISGFRGFGVSNTKQQHTTTPEFRKVKGCGTNTSGFQDSGFRGLEKQGNFT